MKHNDFNFYTKTYTIGHDMVTWPVEFLHLPKNMVLSIFLGDPIWKTKSEFDPRKKQIKNGSGVFLTFISKMLVHVSVHCICLRHIC